MDSKQYPELLKNIQELKDIFLVVSEFDFKEDTMKLEKANKENGSAFSNDSSNEIFSQDNFKDSVEEIDESDIKDDVLTELKKSNDQTSIIKKEETDNKTEKTINQNDKNEDELKKEQHEFDKAEQIPPNPDSIWVVLPPNYRENVKRFLIGKPYGIVFFRAFRELGYRDFFGLCLGLTSCFKERDVVTENCGKIIYKKYTRNTGEGPSKYNPHERDPKPSFNFALKVLGENFCVDRKMFRFISDFITFISETICQIDNKYCDEVKYYEFVRDLRNLTIDYDNKTNTYRIYDPF